MKRGQSYQADFLLTYQECDDKEVNEKEVNKKEKEEGADDACGSIISAICNEGKIVMVTDGGS